MKAQEATRAVMPITPDELQRLLDEPIYSWDVSTLLSGIVDFLEFSEQNLTWQRRREIRRAEQEAEELDFGPDDAHLLPEARRQLVESAELRFDIGLSQSVRYAGVIAYVTSIEWCMELFSARLSSPLPKKPRCKNKAVHILEHINTKLPHPRSAEAGTLEHFVFVRNCIAHAAGLVNAYKYAQGVRDAVAALNGFSISNAAGLGDRIHIAAGAIDTLARQALDWIPALDRECSNNGVFKPTPQA
ncbi:MAG: hypothetical protein M0038_22465 [Pseudomonadota bacterium]|nr:hypothetical protein [Pseudomonadota bacterium]